MKNERAPKVHATREVRVVSFPNRQWQAQVFRPVTDGNGYIIRNKECDPWKALARPTDLGTALQQRDAYAVRLS